MLRFLYLIYYCLIVVPLFLVATILTALVTMAGCMLGGEKIFAFYPGMIWSKLACLLALCPVKVYGKENIKKNESYVFVANHQGAFDIFLIYGFLGVPVKWMMKIGLAKIPFVGAACRAAGFIFVDNSSARAAHRSISEAERRLKNGASLVVFPEGSRSYNGKTGRFRKGAFQIAKDLQLSIVPITLNGPYMVLPAGSAFVHPHRMEMIIHPPVTRDQMNLIGNGNLQPLSDQTHEIIASALWDEFK
ncbi:MAG: 1-acyl-sn-glycerol-3-phosphate acyltransferase [Tannerella sp.]|jgi:1-acyl-sn-glycerol-3-phosphate acyltransferase|nr:1-acyl-sn-glycerol-3-phosphate acyltransferase [Tannerella sp.]